MPSGANTSTLPTDAQGNKLEGDDLKKHLDAGKTVILDQPKDLDKSREQALVEILLSGGLGGIGKLPGVGKAILNSGDEILGSLLDNLIPKNFGSIPVPASGIIDDLAKQAGNFDDLLTGGFGSLQNSAKGLGTAADELFKPFFESKFNPLSPNRLKNPSDLEIDNMLREVNLPAKKPSAAKGGQTEGGFQLSKHANQQRPKRVDSPFPKLKGNNQAINQMASEQAEEILKDPQAVFTRLGRGGTEVMVPDGRGIRFEKDGRLGGFID